MTDTYAPRHPAARRLTPIREIGMHSLHWDPTGAPDAPRVVFLHGWMDVGASYQFLVDALRDLGFDASLAALDWRGFGRTEGPAVDTYWFPDHLADLDAWLDHISPDHPVDLVGHSMGGNVAMSYAGLRPHRVRRLVNLEGFGLPDTRAEQAPDRLVRWLDQARGERAPSLRPYESLDAVAQRLRRTNPRLREDRARWLATEWARPDETTGLWHLLASPWHKRVNPVLYRAEEVLHTWRRIVAPTLWVEADDSRTLAEWADRYPRAEFEARLATVPTLKERVMLADCGHMLHHDQPEELARVLAAFLTD